MDDEMVKKLAEIAKEFLEPMDIQDLINDGLISQIGKSFYLTSTFDELPKGVIRKMTIINQSKNGVRVKFLKLKKSDIARFEDIIERAEGFYD